MSEDRTIPDEQESEQVNPDLANEPLTAAQQRVERERQALLGSLASGQGDTVLQRVAIVLNRCPETRDSDLKLMLRYWELYEGYDGGLIDPRELFERARLMSLTRARARIQNTFKLFQASPTIRKRRGKISDEEYEKAREAAERYPGFTVLIDESGKSGPHLIVGAVWFADPEEFYTLTRKLGEWRTQSGFSKELHFKELEAATEPFYREAIKLVVSEGASVSFKAVSVPKEGVKRVDEALEELMYRLLRRVLNPSTKLAAQYFREPSRSGRTKRRKGLISFSWRGFATGYSRPAKSNWVDS